MTTETENKLAQALREILEYRGGADSALDAPYVMERAREALEAYESRAQPASVADEKENTFREGAPFGSGKCESMSDAIMLVENGWWRDDENVEWVPAAAFRTAVSEIVRLEALLYPVPIPQPPRDIVSVIENVVRAARALRDSQRAYMADRGNEALGKIVGERAADLDAALAAAPQPAQESE